DFYLRSGIQVKMGKEMFPERLRVLSKTLEQLNVPQEQIRYIDLRFDDPVIGPKS
ncbi:MAG: cell division protein FtsQ, partial [Candidatus Omnitrophica bacterium]|nr:cell division protein FtsQ [Candidatus Omnitrophota bacterium]